MIDVLIEKLEAEIAERKALIEAIEHQIQRVIKYAVSTDESSHFSERINIGNFDIARFIHHDSTYSLSVKGTDNITYFYRYANGDYNLQLPYNYWLLDLTKAINAYIDNRHFEMNKKKLSELVQTARSLGIDMTPYEADGQHGQEVESC